MGTAISLLCERLRQSERARRRAEAQVLLETKESLRASHERLHAVIETAADAIIIIDERGLIDAVNPATEGIFGHLPHPIQGVGIADPVAEGGLPCSRCRF
jgi:PAS domain-containing protein